MTNFNKQQDQRRLYQQIIGSVNRPNRAELTAALRKSLEWTDELVADRDARIAELEAALENARKMATIIYAEEYSPYANLRTLIHDFAEQIKITAEVALKGEVK